MINRRCRLIIRQRFISPKAHRRGAHLSVRQDNRNSMSTMTIKSEGKYLPVAALVLHLTVSTTVFMIGRAALFPAFVDTNGVVKASDSQVYLADMVRLSAI